MAVEETPLGFKKPDGASELVKRGAQMIADNAQKAQELIAAGQTAQTAMQADLNEALTQLAALTEASAATDFDGGTPGTVYVAVQTIDGGTV